MPLKTMKLGWKNRKHTNEDKKARSNLQQQQQQQWGMAKADYEIITSPKGGSCLPIPWRLSSHPANSYPQYINASSGGSTAASSSYRSAHFIGSKNAAFLRSNVAKQIASNPDFSSIWQSTASVSTAEIYNDEEESTPSAGGGGLYASYKTATNRFLKGLMTLCEHLGASPTLFKSDKVSCLLEAVDYVAEKSSNEKKRNNNRKTGVLGSSLSGSRRILSDLALAIRIRARVASSFGGPDVSHAYVLSLLIYCWSILQPLLMLPSQEGKSQHSNTNDEDGDDDDCSIDTLDDIIREPVHRPQDLSPELASLTVRDVLIRGDDRFQANVFLQTLNELMGYNIHQYRALKETWREGVENDDPPQKHLGQLMETTVCANFAMQQVMLLEENLAMENPSLNTFYRVLAAAFFPDLIRNLTADVMASSTYSDIQSSDEENTIDNDYRYRREIFPRRAAVEFLGDCIESGFRNPTDPENRVDDLVRLFAMQWDVEQAIVARYAEMTKIAVQLETPLLQEKVLNEQFFEGLPTKMPRMHQWLRHLPHIGCDRSIIHTQRLLQGLSNVCKEGSRLELKRGFFGPQWNDDEKHRATKIQGDLDEFLMGDVLPFLLDICTYGLVSKNLPREAQLCPLFTMIKRFIHNPRTPIPVSFTFGMQTLLTAVFEMQGDGDIHDVALATKSSFDLFISQLQEQQKSPYPQGRAWNTNLERVLGLRLMPVIGDPQPSLGLIERSMWNPLVGGMFLTYITYFANLEGGASLVDSFAQLRIVLHLFNALKERNLIEEGQLPLLDTLYHHFENCKALWEGTRPEQGEFVLRFWIAYGFKTEVSMKLAEQTRVMVENKRLGRPALHLLSIRSDNDAFRRLNPINPEDFSESYRRICLLDFCDVVDRYHTPRQRREGKGNALYEHAVRSNDTMDGMADEQKLLALNLIEIGGIMNEFTYKLFQYVGWQTEIKHIVETTPEDIKTVRRPDGRKVKSESWEASDQNFERYVMMLLFSQRLLGMLDFGNLEENENVMCQKVRKAIVFFKHFFGSKVRNAELSFFGDVEQYEDDEEQEI